MQESMSLKYDPASEPLHISVGYRLYSLKQDDVADLLEAYGRVGYRSPSEMGTISML